MVHMSGLRNGPWGRRGVMRALGVWDERADAVAPEAWVSAQARALHRPAGRAPSRAPLLAWQSERLLVTEGLDLEFGSMAEFDRFAARLLLLGALLRRRVVMPPMPCGTAWAKHAMEPRHLRGLEVGCGPDKQCVWLPMPHFKEAWCSGVDFVYDIDYRTLLANGTIRQADIHAADIGALELAPAPPAGGAAPVVQLRGGGGAPRPERVLLLRGGGQKPPLDWLHLDPFKDKGWKQAPRASTAAQQRSSSAVAQQTRCRDVWLHGAAPSQYGHAEHLLWQALPARVKAALQAAGGLRLSGGQLRIMQDCMHSLATSKD
jgi:hypothetical protein